jgi:hypothetical protein
VWPDAICTRGSTPGSSIQLGYSRQWLGRPRPSIDARHRLCGGQPVTVRVISSQDRLSLHRPIFCNRDGDINFSVQGQNGQDGSNAVNRRNRRRLRPLGSFNFVLFVSLARDDALTLIYSRVHCTLARLSIGSFNKTLSANPAPVNFSGQKNLFSDGSGSIDINADLQASVGISAVAAGSIIPPKVTQFGITFGMLYRVYRAPPSRDND